MTQQTRVGADALVCPGERSSPGAGSEPARPYKNDALRPPWLRFVLPSVGDLLFILLLIALSIGPLAKGMLGDAGIGWHIRTGELIAQTHSVPRIDTFSSTTYGQPWFAWEWLYDVVVGWVHHVAGLNGVVFFSAAIVAFIFALVLRRMRLTNLPIAVLVLLLAVAASTVHFLARPHLVSWLFTVIWFTVVERFEANAQPRTLIWLPLTMLLWVNLHGGFVTGLVLLGLYFVSALLKAGVAPTDTERMTSLRRARTLGVTGVLCVLVSLVNPYGYKLYLHIYQYLGDRFLMDHIDEFLSPNFHGLPQRCFALLVLVALIAMAVAAKKVSLSQLMVALFAIYSGLYATRNIPVSSILLALILTPQLSQALTEAAGSERISEGKRRTLARCGQFGSRMASLDASLRGHLWPIVFVLAGVWICAHQGRIGSTAILHAHFDDRRFPVEAANFLESHGDGQPIFCPDNWGGYLIYRLYPQQRVAVDDRHDLYGAEFLKRYLNIVHGQPGWQRDLADMTARWVLAPKDSTMVALLSESREWRGVYRDETAVLFQREAETTKH